MKTKISHWRSAARSTTVSPMMSRTASWYVSCGDAKFCVSATFAHYHWL
ncbi:MAG: hypothetical protein SPL47_02010 [Bacteroidales bacterium]|nr:hypothetical protein [Bacteroidales bacterium]